MSSLPFLLRWLGCAEQEHAVAMEYLSGVYRNGDGPEISTDGGTTIAGEFTYIHVAIYFLVLE